MVLDQVIGLLVLLSGNAQSGTILTEEQGLARAIAFCRAVERTEFEPLSNPGHRTEVDEIGRYPIQVRFPNMVTFQFRTALISVDLEAGRISGYCDQRAFPWHSMSSAPILTKEQVIELAKRYHKEAGQQEQLDFMSCQLAVKYDAEDNYYILHALRCFGNVPYTEECELYMEIEQRSGRLLKYMPFEYRLPKPPASLVPAVSPETARQKMCSLLLQLYPRIQELTEVRAVHPAIWWPVEQAGGFRFHALSSAQVQLSRDHKGTLIYWGLFGSEDSVFGAWVYLDATNSRVLAVRGPEGSGFGGPTAGLLSVASFAWNIGPLDIGIMRRRQTERTYGRADRASPPKKEEVGKELTLQIGRLYLRSWFLPKCGLLMAKRGGVKTFGRPDPVLSRVLRKLVSGPHYRASREVQATHLPRSSRALSQAQDAASCLSIPARLTRSCLVGALAQ